MNGRSSKRIRCGSPPSSRLLADFDDVAFGVADLEVAGAVAVLLDVSELDAALAQVCSGTLDVGDVEHGSFVVGGDAGGAEDKNDFVGGFKFEAALAVVKFNGVLAQGEFVGVPGSGGGEVEHRNVVGGGGTEAGHNLSGGEV